MLLRMLSCFTGGPCFISSSSAFTSSSVFRCILIKPKHNETSSHLLLKEYRIARPITPVPNVPKPYISVASAIYYSLILYWNQGSSKTSFCYLLSDANISCVSCATTRNDRTSMVCPNNYVKCCASGYNC